MPVISSCLYRSWVLVVACLIGVSGCQQSQPAPALVADNSLSQPAAPLETPDAHLPADVENAPVAATPSPGLQATFTRQPTVTSTATDVPTVTPTPTSTPTQTPVPTPLGYLSRYRLVTYYGNPLGRSLGILGNSPREEMTEDLREYAAEFQALSPDRVVLPTYHMVSTVAHTEPPGYSYRIGNRTIQEWVLHASGNNVAAILDLQPGRVDLMEEVENVRHLLYFHHVHLAIDPEWYMLDWQIPGVHIGQIEAAEINAVQEVLNEIAQEIGVNRVLLVHQFKDSMIVDKENILDYPYVELVIVSDGAFNARIKMQSYHQYAGEPGYDYLGIKLFSRRDDRVIPPDELMRLTPPPDIIILQ